MAGLTPLTSPGLINLQSSQYVAQAKNALNDGQGEPLGDIWHANAQVQLLSDTNVQYVNNKARLTTSTGADIDTFVSPYGIVRDPPTYTQGQVQITPKSVSLVDNYVQLGALCTTTTGVQFQVIADSAQAAYRPNAGYLIPAGSLSPIYVTVNCLSSGSVGNVGAGTIKSLASGLGTQSLGSVGVTNLTPFVGGIDGELDAAVIARFSQTFSSGRYGTTPALGAAVNSAQANLVYQIAEGFNSTGVSTPGFVSVFVNQSIFGTTPGTAPAGTISAVTAALLPIHASGIQYGVYSPTITAIPMSATLVLDPTYILNPSTPASSVRTASAVAYANYVNTLPISIAASTKLIYYAKVSALLYSVPGVVNVTGLLVNGGTSDVTANYGYQLVAGTATIS